MSVKMGLFSVVLCGMMVSSYARTEIKDSSNNVLVSASTSQNSDFQACIDDSDCYRVGAKYNCFQYICYPFHNDSLIPPESRKRRCSKNEECGDRQACHRHHDIRVGIMGLCMDEFGDCKNNGERDCKGQGPDKCCNGQYCCEGKCFDKLKNLPCLNHLMCKDLGYGDYCCPQKHDNSTKVCCDVNPNPPPPPTEAPKVESLNSAVSAPVFSLATLLATIKIFKTIF